MLKIAKSAIDNISSTGIAYEITNRKTTKCLLFLSCTPCVLFSTLTRLVSCPFQCLFNRNVSCNPFLACMTDSSLTFKSDDCICSAISAADKVIKTTAVLTLTEEEEIEVLIYAAKKIQCTPLIKDRYSIADFVKPIILKQTLFASSTPANVIKSAEEAMSSIKCLNKAVLYKNNEIGRDMNVTNDNNDITDANDTNDTTNDSYHSNVEQDIVEQDNATHDIVEQDNLEHEKRDYFK